MPTLTLYIDLSPNFPFAFASIQDGACTLRRRGRFVPPALPWAFGKMLSHQPLWGAMENKEQGTEERKSLPPHWQNWLKTLLQAVSRNEDILLYGREAHLGRQKGLLALLHAQPELAPYALHIVAVIGRPASFFEQTARLVWPGQPANVRWFALARECAQAVELINLWRSEAGAGQVSLFADTSELPVATGLSAGHCAALQCLGLSRTAQMTFPAHPLCLASREARHILLLSEVNNNSWPSLDKIRFIEQLREMEQKAGWDARPISTPKYRAALNSHTERSLSQLEDALHLRPGALACPAELEADNSWQAYPGLSDEVIQKFTDSLPRSLADTLFRRYIQDNHLLWPGQKRIYKSLASSPDAPVNITSRVEERPLVSVLTLTRNQENYIEKCIESVLAQQTDFPVQHIILDHCSTDKTPDIICKYAEKYTSIRPILLSQWVNGQNVKGLFSRCRSKYAALCDGDDYFTDLLKLQKQVDFLEAHPECALCFHPVDVIYEDGSPARVYPPENLLPGGIRTFYTIKDLLYVNLIQTNSAMYRWRFYDGLPDWFDATLVPGDWYWHLLHAETGLIGYLRDRMSVYFRHSRSLYASAEGNHIAHRQLHGLDELRMYRACNQHFQGRYYTDLCTLAAGVFADFLQHYATTGNDSLLAKGAEICPGFASDFLKKLEIHSSEQG